MILIVGNVLKDVYLNLDARTEHFEQDAGGTPWLDLSFDTSEHHYFRRTSSFGGAAVSLEVLEKLGLKASVNCSDFSFNDTDVQKSTPADAYRYILTTDGRVSYLTPTLFQRTNFILPEQAPDYIYIDRSANLDQPTALEIKSYLDLHPEVGLVLHLKKSISPSKNLLLNLANLIFSENPDIPELKTIDAAKVIYLSEDALTYKSITEPISVERIDTLTHLSVFTIAATTVLGGFLLGRTVEDSLKLARANVENAKLDTCLTLKELDNVTAIASDSPALLTAAYLSAPQSVPAELIFQPTAELPIGAKRLHKFFANAYKNGFRFVELTDPSPDKLAHVSKACQSAGLVPIIVAHFKSSGNLPITKVAVLAGQFLDGLLAALNSNSVDFRAVILKIPSIQATKDYKEPSVASDISAATTEVLNRHLPAPLRDAVIIIPPELPLA